MIPRVETSNGTEVIILKYYIYLYFISFIPYHIHAFLRLVHTIFNPLRQFMIIISFLIHFGSQNYFGA